MQTSASAVAPARGPAETGQRAGGDSVTVSSGMPAAGAVAAVRRADRPPSESVAAAAAAPP